MAIDYVVQENNFDPGKFHIRTVPRATRRKDDLAQQIAEKSLVQPADINAVLDTLDDEIISALIAGDNVIIDDFIGFAISVNLKQGVDVTDQNYTIDPDDIDVNISLRNKPAILKQIERVSLRRATSTKSAWRHARRSPIRCSTSRPARPGNIPPAV